MMSMQKVDSVDVAPGKDLRFAPGGYHLMLMGLKQPLVAGERFPLTLHFRKAGDVPVEIVVESRRRPNRAGTSSTATERRVVEQAPGAPPLRARFRA